ncbi:MAG TPA: 6-carboxytetrahydropterin synthase [Parachlamydiaceae bacterium]|nr:6-carboxytetrahydropterin synthase [Parachlamydiaceae bacterium]
MSRIKCVRKICFSSGHRVFGHEGPCKNPHGHNYSAHIFAESNGLDQLGRVIDFSVLKEKIGGWINRYFDHTFLVYEKDEEMIQALKMVKTDKEPFICPFNPTAENIANYLLLVVAPKELEGHNVKVTKIVLYETENCYAISAL